MNDIEHYQYAGKHYTKKITAYQGSHCRGPVAKSLQDVCNYGKRGQLVILSEGYYFTTDKLQAQKDAIKLAKKRKTKTPHIIKANLHYNRVFDNKKLNRYYDIIAYLEHRKGYGGYTLSDERKVARRVGSSLKIIEQMSSLHEAMKANVIKYNDRDYWDLKKDYLDKGFDLILRKANQPVVLDLGQVETLEYRPLDIRAYMRMAELTKLTKSNSKSKAHSR